jgi:hypothetical protein
MLSDGNPFGRRMEQPGVVISRGGLVGRRRAHRCRQDGPYALVARLAGREAVFEEPAPGC